MSSNTEANIKTTVRHTKGRGTHIAITDYKTDRLIAYLGEQDEFIDPNTTPMQRIKIAAAFDNFRTLIKRKQHASVLSKVSILLPAEIVKDFDQAFVIAEKKKIEFKPYEAMIGALVQEISRILNKSEVPGINKLSNKHIEARRIFEKLTEIKGFLAVYQKFVRERFEKPVKDDAIQLQHLHNYRYGKAKPALWVYACALETLHELKQDVFKLGVSHDEIFDLWYSAHKSTLSNDQILEKFKAIFDPSQEILSGFKKFLDSKTES